MIKSCTLILLIAVGCFAQLTSLADYLYEHRVYISERANKPASFFNDSLIYKSLPKSGIFYDYSSISRDSIQNLESHIVNNITTLSQRINSYYKNMSYRITDSVMVGILIRILPLPYKLYSQQVEDAAKILLAEGFIPELNRQRVDLIEALAYSGLSKKKKVALYSYITLPDSIKSSLLEDTTLDPITRLRITQNEKGVDSLIANFEKIPANTGFTQKEKAAQEIISIGTNNAIRFGISIFNDSIYSIYKNCIGRTIKYTVLQELSKRYDLPLLQSELVEILRDPIKKIQHDKWSPAYITACNLWFREEFGMTPRTDVSKTISTIIGNCKEVD